MTWGLRLVMWRGRWLRWGRGLVQGRRVEAALGGWCLEALMAVLPQLGCGLLQPALVLQRLGEQWVVGGVKEVGV